MLAERQGRLEQTIIVVTADHGIRTRTEDPNFPVGMIDEYSFHLPLLIWAPKAVSTTVTISYPTSHIDIAPTVLDLLGTTGGRVHEQGSPIWDTRLQDRTMFYPGQFMLGSSAFSRGGEFFMHRHMTDLVYQSDRLRFQGSEPLNCDSPIHAEVVETLLQFAELQQAYVKKLTHWPDETGK